jgi:hypothetical protein
MNGNDKLTSFHRFFYVIAFCLIAGPAAAAPRIQCHSSQEKYFDALGIQTDFQAAKQLADEEKKPLVLIFSAKNTRLPGFQ